LSKGQGRKRERRRQNEGENTSKERENEEREEKGCVDGERRGRDRGKRGEGHREQDKFKKRGREGKDWKERNVAERLRKDQGGQRLKYWPLIDVLPGLATGKLGVHDLHCDGSLEGVLHRLLRQELISCELMHCRSPIRGI
jgi:hypothetical protein